MKNLLITTCIILLIIPTINAQDEPNPITTAAPFLLIVPDARAGGMGDIGVATTADANSQHHNPAQYAFLNSQFSVGVNYTPWMRELVSDVFLGGFTIANRLDDRSAWAASLKYFTLGEIELRETGDPNETVIIEKPSELSFDGTYALNFNGSYFKVYSFRFCH
jgi:hypothetical protein